MAPRILRFKKTIIVASIAALSLVGAGAAFAYWTSTGTGDGEAQTGTQAGNLHGQCRRCGRRSTGTGRPAGQTVSFTVTNSGPEPLLLWRRHAEHGHRGRWCGHPVGSPPAVSGSPTTPQMITTPIPLRESSTGAIPRWPA